MVKTITGEIYVCDVCGERSLNKEKLEEHEKLPIAPLFDAGENVNGHYLISDNPSYAFTSFKVLGINKEKHAFIYNLEPMRIESFHGRFHHYSGPSFFKKDSKWTANHKEDKEVLNSLEGKLGDIPLNYITVALSEEKLRKIRKLV